MQIRIETSYWLKYAYTDLVVGNFVAYGPKTRRLKWTGAPPTSCLSTRYRWRSIRVFVTFSEWCSFHIILKLYSEDGEMLPWLERPYEW